MSQTNVLELGNFISVAYAGMVLAEQGYRVEKWTAEPGRDPLFTLHRGEDLWHWLNDKKRAVIEQPITKDALEDWLCQRPDGMILDNIRASTWERWGICPELIAHDFFCRWVSIRPDVGEYGFDPVAQCQAIREYGPQIPWYIGDTAAGLWAAFKLIAGQESGHFVVWQSSVLAKLVEGELMFEDLDWSGPVSPFSKGTTYEVNADGVRLSYRDKFVVEEPIRNRAWKLAHLHHDGTGRLVV